MNRELVDRVVKAVLYEGYLLYPYRPSVKNHKRWTFGGLYPRRYCAAQIGADNWFMQTECLVAGNDRAKIHGSVRFLHLMTRRVAEHAEVDADHPGFRFVETLRVGEQLHQSWQEAVEREVSLGEWDVYELIAQPRQLPFAFSPSKEVESVRDPAGREVGFIVRTQQAIAGVAELSARSVAEGLY